MLQLGNGQQLDFAWCHGFPPLVVIGIILPARVILHWPEPLCVKSMHELQTLCVKLPLRVAGSGGNFFGNHTFGGNLLGNLAFGNLST